VPKLILAAVQDLLFKSKISETADQLGANVKFARKPERLLESARTEDPDLIIFDLGSDHLRPLELLAALKNDPEVASIPTLGYLPHVEQELAEAARNAGCDRVMPRGAFTKRLPELLSDVR
jgi:CheY-like chemotaxis protein